jgi:hypothetical protein
MGTATPQYNDNLSLEQNLVQLIALSVGLLDRSYFMQASPWVYLIAVKKLMRDGKLGLSMRSNKDTPAEVPLVFAYLQLDYIVASDVSFHRRDMSPHNFASQLVTQVLPNSGFALVLLRED